MARSDGPFFLFYRNIKPFTQITKVYKLIASRIDHNHYWFSIKDDEKLGGVGEPVKHRGVLWRDGGGGMLSQRVKHGGNNIYNDAQVA